VGSERTIVMDRAAIEAVIPHREPFLFVDRVVELTCEAITTEWDVSRDLPAFHGHYPGAPILPGVLASEFAFQSAALLLVTTEREMLERSAALSPADGLRRTPSARAVPMLTKIEEARFKKAVKPGETLRASVERIERVGPAHFMKAAITSAGATVLKMRFTVALVDPSAGGE
jgi:3-hydroxyacyl-[acyl-carrier-protein] dehydratase